MSIGTISYSLGVLAFLLLTLMLVTGWRGRLQGGLLLAACAGTTAWALVLALQSHLSLSSTVIQFAETLKAVLWFAFLLKLLSTVQGGQRGLARIPLALYTLAVALVLFPHLSPHWLAAPQISRILLAGYLALAVGGLWLVEMLYRNTPVSQRWSIKFLCVGIGGMFSYDLFLYSHGLLFGQLSPGLWHARGVIHALVVPLIAISVARNPDWSFEMFVSRKVVYHTASLVGTGVYLLFMAVVGYYLRAIGGEWGTLVQAVFLFGAAVLLLVMLFSGQLRARLRVLVNKHFYQYKYDYRDEWVQFTHALSGCKDDDHPYECVIGSIAELVDSPGGMLWMADERGRLSLRARLNLPEPGVDTSVGLDSLVAFLQRSGWVVNLDEYARTPDFYQDLELPAWLETIPEPWVIVPLTDREQLQGFVLLTQPRAAVQADWEVRDLLKTAAMQAASHLAQMQALQALAEARQFEGFNRLSAFILHDIKNLIAQQSVVVSSAARHKHNPAFIDDAVRIMEHSVGKMQRLMQLLRTGMAGGIPVTLSLPRLLNEIVDKRCQQQPCPEWRYDGPDIEVTADRDRLTSAIENLVQNAQEATRRHGHVMIRLHKEQGQAMITVEDDGVGMDDAFIRERLFRPFDTTKGDTGMGIGAYDSREYLRALQGDLTVVSKPGQGTVFTIRIPLLDEAMAEQLQELDTEARM
ncbi:MAG TPA: XrtA/PEP-CTERM system histidine kinase PrsK [Gammaproteobacteria bacterium]|nr:XrtA/PEP-CTERM system histidine kinase PrsK [Gammaproteobacteria bacterium]